MSREQFVFTFHNVSIKSEFRKETRPFQLAFTFHNVSIKSSSSSGNFRHIILYIPQCLY